MTRFAGFLLLLSLTACREQPQTGNQAAPGAPAKPRTAKDDVPIGMPPATAEGKKVRETNDLLEFSYAWPLEASRIEPLNNRLESELVRDRATAMAMARDDRRNRPADAPFNGHYFQKTWDLHGDSPQLMSLAGKIATFTGGAHGNSLFDQILWDKQRNQAIETADLFRNPAQAFAILSRLYCPALDRERADKREGPVVAGEDPFNACPPLDKQRMVPSGPREGRFTSFEILIPPYEAGPYAEGSYEIRLPIMTGMIALLKPEYADSFRVEPRRVEQFQADAKGD